eukprot:TRINITY_DN10970_c0_g1_i2.p1 TRINITY_DN10970_c0_g1~~TRINITY_DN10970_c0_g1_i2.p1  ORF type:complete len:487 (-),score=112.88 TRINITY_DN10970_c0_g1_i2:37-1497(-)
MCIRDSDSAGSLESFTVDIAGTNIVVLNLMLLIPVTIVLGYSLSDELLEDYKVLLFGLGVLSIVPLCFSAGSLITRIAVKGKSSLFGMMLSCTLGRSVELLLYLHLMRRSLNNLVRDAIVGALLGLMLLLPALTFAIGGLRFREQKFNLPHAGLSSVMLLVAVFGGFAPTLFYEAYAKLEMFCAECTYIPNTNDLSIGCNSCHYKFQDIASEPLYQDYAKHVAIVCASLLPTSYLFGLAFLHHWDKSAQAGSPSGSPRGQRVLRLSEDEAPSPKHSRSVTESMDLVESMPALLKEGVHGKEGWSIFECSVALFLCLGVAYGVTDVTASAASRLYPDDLASGAHGARLPGLVLLGLAPNILHFVNAISFGFKNKIGMSIEIASSAVIQIALIQIPIMIFFSAYAGFIKDQQGAFTMIFSTFHTFAVFFSVIILNYISLAGRVNYFEGVALAVVYFVWVAAFMFMPSSQVITSEMHERHGMLDASAHT